MSINTKFQVSFTICLVQEGFDYGAVHNLFILSNGAPVNQVIITNQRTGTDAISLWWLGAPNIERGALTRRLEALREPPGFTGNAPGGPSRWSAERSSAWEPLRPELVVEVSFDQVTAGRFRHGATLMRWRPDKASRQCTMDQLAPVTARSLRSGRPCAALKRAEHRRPYGSGTRSIDD